MQLIRRGLMFGALALAPMIAGAGDIVYGPNLSLYVSYAFGAPPAQEQAASLHYGFRVDHDWRQHLLPGQQPALLEWQFDLSGFEHLSISGLPIVNSRMILHQSGDGGFFDYITNNFGTIVLVGGGGLLVGLMALGIHSENERGLNDIDKTEATVIDCSTFKDPTVNCPDNPAEP